MITSEPLPTIGEEIVESGDGSREQAYLDTAHAVGDRLLAALAVVCDQHDIEYVVYCGTLLGAVREQGWIPWDDDVDVAMRRAEYERFRSVCAASLPPPVRFSDARSDPHHLSSIAKLLFTDSRRAKAGRPRKFRPVETRHLALDIFVLDVAPDRAAVRRWWRRGIALSERMIVSRAMTLRQALDAQETSRLLTLAAVVVSRAAGPRGWRRLHFLICTGPQRFASGDVVSGTNHIMESFRRIDLRPSQLGPVATGTFGDLEVPIPARADEVLALMYGDRFMQPPPTDDRAPLHRQDGMSVTLDGVELEFPAASAVAH